MTTSDPFPLGHFLLHPLEVFSAAGQFAADSWPAAVPVAVGICAAIGTRRVLAERRSQASNAEARYLLIKAPPQVEQGCAEAFWTHLHAVLRSRQRSRGHLAFEFIWAGEGLDLGIWVPATVPVSAVAAAVEAAWPGAHAQIVLDVPQVAATKCTCVAGGELRLAKPEYLPFKTKHESDPLRPLLRSAGSLRDGERACLQVLVRPATGRRVRRLRRQLDRFRTDTLRGPGPAGAGAFLDEWAPAAHPRRGQRADPVHAAALRAAVGKTVGPLWAAQIRYVVTTEVDSGAAQRRVRSLAGAVAAALGVYAERNWWEHRSLRRPAEALTARSMSRGDLLTVAELASIAHLPMDPGAVGVTRAGARSVPPPPSIRSDTDGAKILGDADAGRRRPVGVAIADARQHFHIMGATNSGKSTLMARMILDDVRARRGVLVLDPKGDLVGDLLDRLPTSAADRLVLIDPTDSGPRPSLNILAQGDPELMVDNVVGIFRRLFASSWGPRTDDVLRAACLTLIATAKDRPPTLADVSQLLSDKTFRAARTAGLAERGHRVLDHFWTSFGDLSAPSQTAVTAPLQNKLRAFLLRSFVCDVIARPRSTIDLGQVLDGGICLVRLPKGVLGEDTMRLLGSFILAAAWQATTARAARPEQERPDAAIYLDEAHNFLNLPYSLEDMLAEARAYRVSFNLAHQNLAQLPKDLAEGISTNARNKVFFTCSPEDARALAPHTGPLLSEHDLAHLGAYQAAARLTSNSEHARAFTVRTRPAPAAIPGRAEAIRAVVHAAAARERR